MADISKIKIGDTEYDVKDAVARAQGAGVIGFAADGSRINVRGESVFGVLVFCGNQQVGAFAYDSSNYACSENISGTFYYDTDEASFMCDEETFYIIFGATSITVED